MNIILSAHFDVARPIPFISLNEGKLNGLVDNFAGVFAAYQSHRKTNVPLYMTNFEELEFDGAIELAKHLAQDSLVIVVDTILQEDIGDKSASIANVYGIDTRSLEKHLPQVHFKHEFFEETEDETWIYGHKFGLKTLYFGVPIPGEYHSVENSITLNTIDTASEMLTKVCNLLQG